MRNPEKRNGKIKRAMEEKSRSHYQHAHVIIQHLIVKHEDMSMEDKILQLKLVHSHLNYVRHFSQRKELALELAKYAVMDKDAVLTVGVHFPENIEEEKNVS